VPAGKRSNGAALGISNPPRHSASARRVAVCSISARLCMREDAARTANEVASCATAMIWCKPSSPSTLVAVRSPTPPWKDMQGVWEQAHSGTPPSNGCNLPSRAALAELQCCCLWPPSSGCAWGLRRLAVAALPLAAGRPSSWRRYESGRRA
jgi:hypothetical protein